MVTLKTLLNVSDSKISNQEATKSLKRFFTTNFSFLSCFVFCVSPDLQQFNGVKRFELERSCCFGALLLDEERGRLFVGGRNYLLSLSLDNISKQEQKVQYIFSPFLTKSFPI